MARGYNALGDVIKTSADGQPLDSIWDEMQETLQIRNTSRTAIASLFTYATTLASDTVAQSMTDAEFEESSEYGVPESTRTSPSLVTVGFPLRWYDHGARYTWKFLAEASRSQIEAAHSSALEADNKLIFRKVMGALFSNVNPGPNDLGTPVVALWNGDGQAPPEHANQTFTGTHSHYLTTGTVDLAPKDVEDLIGTVEHHGYGLTENGDRLIVLANPMEAEVIRGFRAGVNDAKFDFIPSTDAPAFITDETIVGDRPPGSFNGLKVVGSYGDAWVVKNEWVPAGYVVAVATSGPNSPSNPLAFREHTRVELQGLKQVPGPGTYPLAESYYVRGFGVGVRHRGAAAVLQVTASTTYTPPVIK